MRNRGEDQLDIKSVMNDEHWKLWKQPGRRMSESILLRYGVAVALPVLATCVIHLRPVFAETPYFIFLGAVVLSAVNGGAASAFVATGLSAVFIRLFYVRGGGGLHFGSDWAGIEQMGGFVLVALLLGSFVAGLRRDVHRLRDSEERYRLLAETASDAIVVIDEKGEILYVNHMAEKLFGRGAGELLGQALSRLLPGDEYQAQLTEMRHRLDSRKKPVALQLPGLHQSGDHLLVEMTLGSSSHRGRGAFTAVIREIAARPL